jgi:hypothetical protein
MVILHSNLRGDVMGDQIVVEELGIIPNSYQGAAEILHYLRGVTGCPALVVVAWMEYRTRNLMWEFKDPVGVPIALRSLDAPSEIELLIKGLESLRVSREVQHG